MTETIDTQTSDGIAAWSPIAQHSFTSRKTVPRRWRAIQHWGWVCLLVTGCIPTSPDDATLETCRDDVLDALFTPDAAAALREVPIRHGSINGSVGFSAGNDWGSQFVSGLYGNGFCRQVLLGPGADAYTVFHEYTHEADYSGLISRTFFEERLEQLLADPDFGPTARALSDAINRAYTAEPLIALSFAYDDGPTRELIAFMADEWLRGECDWPAYFLDVYSGAIDWARAQAVRGQLTIASCLSQ